MSHVWFPLSGAASFVIRSSRRRRLVSAIVGPEGVLASPFTLADPALPAFDAHVVWLIPGDALRVPVRLVQAQPELVRRVELVGQLLAAELLREVICASEHPVQERTARWLLEFRGRAGADTFELTHETLAQVLRTGRPTATHAMHELAAAGQIRYQRGIVEVLRPQALRTACCGCYRAGEAVRHAHLARISSAGIDPG